MQNTLHMIDDLQAHVPFDTDEARSLDRILAHAKQSHQAGQSPFDRRRFDGHITGSAFILNAEKTHFLLLFHKKLSRWLQPGGHGEADETHVRDVARREATEETAIDGLSLLSERPFDVDVHTIPQKGDELQHEHLDVRYLFVAPADANPRIDPNESRALKWVPLQECLTFEPSIARAARKCLALEQS